ncbi:MAG: serine hydrolase [candidate division Zixibacteria bacterium]|nr:serine hydrolase [candidate division KSB1 bacterium]NIR62634.1 serine hydrolase [candidate division Zixibacteria bacterium]NIW43599.1 serine hydrolase [Gammaproteobacteria bacterium]NIT69698.1 serine hydrolase [candidate division KSB1 bacterium]NIU12813.1 serine hydrolase [candidate division Zixibacteria bacterium]
MKEGNAAYSLYTTVEDYAKFMAALINRKDVSEKTVSQMLTPQGHVSDKDADTLQVLQSVAWGLGVGLQMTEDGTAFWHWGDNGSFKCLMIGYPGEKVGMVYFTNSANGLSIAKALVQNSLGGDCPALDWLNYDAYNSPTAVFIHTALNRGVKTAIEEFHAASKNNNETLLLDETRINQFGYHLMNNGKTDQARKIFRLNMEMHPRSGNVYDSYAEVHLVSGNQEVAAQYYQKSVELNPENEHGKRLLKQLLPGYKSQGNTTFVLERYADANLVTLAGSFNDWNPLHTLLHREGDRWVCRIDLEPGKYTYKFVVDGEWITDPDNPRTETDEAGHTNSVLNVQ